MKRSVDYGARMPGRRSFVPTFLARWPGWFLAGLLPVLAALAAWLLMTPPVWESTVTIRIDPEYRTPAFESGDLVDLARKVDVRTEMHGIPVRNVLLPVARDLDLGFRVLEPRNRTRDALFASVDVDSAAVTRVYELEPAAENRWRLRQNWPAEETLGTVGAGDTVKLPGARFTLRPGDGRIRFATTDAVRAARALRQSLSGEPPDPSAHLIDVRYRTTDRLLAPRVANAVAASFVEQTRRVRSGEARSRATALASHLRELSLEVGAAADSLGAFAATRGMADPETERTATVRRSAAMARRVETAQREREAVDELLGRLESPGADAAALAAYPALLGRTSVSRLLADLTSARLERRRLLERYEADHPDVVGAEARIDGISAAMRDLVESYRAALSATEVETKTRLAELREGAVARIPDEVRLERQRRRANLLAELRTRLERSLTEAELAANAVDASVRVVGPAVLPDEPVRPRPIRDAGIALLAGLGLGLLLAWLRDRVDGRLREPGILTELGAGVLARVPARGDGVDEIEIRDEQFAHLRTSLRYLRLDGSRQRLFVVTGPGPEETTAAVASGLSRSFAREGADVLHVTRSPGTPGFVDVLAGDAALEAAVARRNPERGESAAGPDELPDELPAGGDPAALSGLLGRKRAVSRLADFLERYDRVVVDAGPLPGSAAAPVLARLGDGVLFAVAEGESDQRAAIAAARQLGLAGARVLGVVWVTRGGTSAGLYGRRTVTRRLATS